MFFVLLLPCLGVVCWNEIVEEKGDMTFGTMSAIGQAMAQFMIFVGPLPYSWWRVPMFAEQFLRRREEEGRQRGLAQGRKEQDQEWREFLDVLKSELERKGIEVELPAPPSPP